MSKANQVIEISPNEVAERLEKGEMLNIVDVREDEEVALGTILGALHIRLSELSYWLDEINPDQETIFICKTGRRSTVACQEMMKQGYPNTKSMTGGLVAYQRIKKFL